MAGHEDHEGYLPPSVSFAIHGIGLTQDVVLDRMMTVLRSVRSGVWPDPLPNGITFLKNHGGGGPNEGNPRIPWMIPTALDVRDLPDD